MPVFRLCAGPACPHRRQVFEKKSVRHAGRPGGNTRLPPAKKKRLLTAGLHLRQGRGIVLTAAFGYARRLRLPATLPPAGKLAAGGM